MPENWKDIKGDDPRGRFEDSPASAEPIHDVEGSHKGFLIFFPYKRFGGGLDVILPVSAGALLAALIFGPLT